MNCPLGPDIIMKPKLPLMLLTIVFAARLGLADIPKPLTSEQSAAAFKLPDGSKTLRDDQGHCEVRQVLECASPLAL